MFQNLGRHLAGNANQTADAKKAMSPSLRGDLYSSMDQAKLWLVGGVGGGQAGDGVSYKPMLALVQKHFPDTKLGFELIGNAENEVAVIVGGITNMAMEMSKWDGMAGAMAMRTWTDLLVEAHTKIGTGSRQNSVAKGIMRGVNHNTDTSLMTKEFTTKIQIISLLKTLGSRIYGPGSDEARNGEALWSSKFI